MDLIEAEVRQFEWGDYGATIIHPAAIVLLVFALWLLLNGPRRLFVIPVVVIAMFVTSAQRIAIGPLDFTLMRLLLVGGIVRAVLRKDAQGMKWNSMDSFLIAYAIVGAITYIALWQNSAAVVHQLGRLYNILLVYFLIRLYVVTEEQIVVLLRALAWICVLSAVFMMIEQVFHYNLFSVFGGVRPNVWIREGRLRAQGSFSHAIMAGTFGAAFVPLFWGLWSMGGVANRRHAAWGAAGAVTMTMASASSGPVLTLMASTFAIAMWRYRRYTVLMKRLAVAMIVALHLVMQAPVWHLIARIDIVGGSTGYHRYRLIDAAINRFSEWALVGVRGTRHWGWLMHDVTNQFIAVAVDGGLFSLILFILLIRAGFKIVATCKAFSISHEAQARLWWAWGATLFAHCVSFIGVSYFGQMTHLWYLTLAIIASLPVTRNNWSMGTAQDGETVV